MPRRDLWENVNGPRLSYREAGPLEPLNERMELRLKVSERLREKLPARKRGVIKR